jgi:hypothetical protein
MFLSLGRGGGVMFTVTADMIGKMRQLFFKSNKNICLEIRDIWILSQFLVCSHFTLEGSTILHLL